MCRTALKPPLRLLAVVGLLVIAGCSGGATTPAPATTATTPATATTGTASPAAAPRVTAELTDFTITLSQTSFGPGQYTFVAEQRGQSSHALAIAGPGASGQTSVVQPGGAGQELTVSLQPGMYELWCPVGNHRALGMTATMTVA